MGVSTAQSFAQKKKKGAKTETTTSEHTIIMNEVNRYRASLGLPSLVMNETISNSAYEHSLKMAQGSVPFGHAGFDKRMKALMSQIAASGAAENVAFSPKGPHSVVHNWLNSDGHRENIEGDYNYAGVGIAVAKNGYKYYTIIFVKKK
jgi:uncharacterized protein YkwD